MRKLGIILILLFFAFSSRAQTPVTEFSEKESDSLRKKEFYNYLGQGYFPVKYFNIDLRSLIKYNQYEGIRAGFGGVTSKKFSEKFRINAYIAYGFRDHTYKYRIGSGFRLAEKTNTWLNASFTNDLQETGSTTFLTDGRNFQFFEPRLLNIDLFHRHYTSALSIEHNILSNLLNKTQIGSSEIRPTYNYEFVVDDNAYHDFSLTTITSSLQWFPGIKTNKEIKRISYPIVTLQFTQSVKNLFSGDFKFTKLDFKTIHQLKHRNTAISELTFTSGIAKGHTPLTHLYHVYPNNINKETILQRFSVAGITSFETMFFNEFFSDRFITLQYKYFFKPFRISEYFNPQLVLITRYALGNMDHIDRHQNATFGTLEKGFTESGLEINKLLFGFGLSLAYRYGAYHLPEFGDNVALKFTFNITL
ncbi:hypothetical protein RXV94_10980 [Yeosuana sp. MJ-SS3]|uniref:Bacterial surface antigen (D15) domain-containing protein n=1 Tax=Gilvirhabdus luticola TaxID=3079858 RepID=A0ABU3U8H9_9FLAO|nr:hypothetical protein [Yeosuana sp. MJ-SS3]MDU8886685.1 hypothetical protein [Yeosuana sp. MJ-SS3]